MWGVGGAVLGGVCWTYQHLRILSMIPTLHRRMGFLVGREGVVSSAELPRTVLRQGFYQEAPALVQATPEAGYSEESQGFQVGAGFCRIPLGPNLTSNGISVH